MYNPITHSTPAGEIIRRVNNEHARSIYWANKIRARRSWEQSITKLPDSPVLEYMRNHQNHDVAGYTEYVCPDNGDRWIAVFSKMRGVRHGEEGIYVNADVFYTRETTGSFDIIMKMDVNAMADNEDGSTIPGLMMFTSHCMRRVKERMNVNVTPIEMYLFLLSNIQLSSGYVYDRSGVPTVELCCPFGVFRGSYKPSYQIAIYRTFINQEQFDFADKERWKKQMKIVGEYTGQVMLDMGDGIRVPIRAVRSGENAGSGIDTIEALNKALIRADKWKSK